MKLQEARQIGERTLLLLDQGQVEKAYTLLSTPLSERTPFRILDGIGEAIGGGEIIKVTPLLNRIADGRTMGGWVIIGKALSMQWGRDSDGPFSRAREYIIAADLWYACDSMAERLPGPALVKDFEQALTLLSSWRTDANTWVRRAVGVSAHFWAKRSHGETAHLQQAQRLLDFLEPMFNEKNRDAIKGIGWGLKTIGRYYPEPAADWLAGQTSQNQTSKLMIRKALRYLPPEQRERVMSRNS